MATEADIFELSKKILEESLQPEFIKDLMDWGRVKYKISSGSLLLAKVQSRKLYMDFLQHLFNSGWHKDVNGVYHIIKYLSHGEMAPMPIHVRMLLDGDKKRTKNYVSNIRYERDRGEG